MKEDRGMTVPHVDFDDIQGLVRFGYKHHTEACFFVLQVADAAAARAWLAGHEFASAAKGKPADTVLQVAFTFAGLDALGVPRAVLDGFPTEFRIGMTGDEGRSRRLGDVGPNDPKCWEWGGPRKAPPHVLVMLFAKPSPKSSALQSFKAKIRDERWKRAFRELACLPTSDMHGYEPFRFKDGISQPELDWDRKIPARLRNTRNYTNMSALGEFVLGYPNEYARYTDRPLLDRKDDPQEILFPAEDAPGKKDFGRNGTYLVVRDLSQDVAAFWKYADDQAKHDPLERQMLAEAMVGRTMSGEPIVPPESQPIEGVKPNDAPQNQFTFRSDPNGTACPFGAHIRRANPRNADLPDGTKGWFSFVLRMLGFGGKGAHYDLLASSRFHRILRRGREYGPALTIDEALREEGPPDGGRGLRFICLNANISRQFEFVQDSWIGNPKFDGLEESDPLLGNREPLLSEAGTDTFTHPQASGICRRFEKLPRFVTVRGGAYFFLPGLSALRYVCGDVEFAPCAGDQPS
jgi:Dyp-type peroxidase family